LHENYFISFIIWKGEKIFSEKCHERNITGKSSTVHKTALNCREVYNNTRKKVLLNHVMCHDSLKYPNDETYSDA